MLMLWMVVKMRLFSDPLLLLELLLETFETNAIDI